MSIINKKSAIGFALAIIITLSVGLYCLFLIRIPITKLALGFLEKRSQGLTEAIDLKVEEISIDLKGKIFIRGLQVGAPVACDINNLEVDFSLLDWISGKLMVDNLEADSIVIFKENMLAMKEPLLQLFESNKISPLDYVRQPQVNVERVLFLDSNSQVFLNVQEAEVEVENDKVLWTRVEAARAGWGDLPPFENFSFLSEYEEGDIRFSKIKTTWQGAGFKGWAKLLKDGDLKSFVEFKGVDLEKFSGGNLQPDEKIEGIAEGNFLVAGVLDDVESINADGDLFFQNLRLKNLPVQKDMVVQSYMPDLQDLRMKKVSLPAFRLRGKNMFIDTLFGEGSPLSFSGKGKVQLPLKLIGPDFDIHKFEKSGKLELFLTCHLEENYYEKLKPLVKEGLYRDDEDLPTFKCQIKGDLKSQSIFLEKVVGRVIKSISRKMTRTLKGLFK